MINEINAINIPSVKSQAYFSSASVEDASHDIKGY